ncbi:hypothetical protein [Mesobacillus selenatarsenatis]|uniref:Peptidylprolyl isomerase n=1 Tax=Mesobacillus selenatarsenatis (strain DSM 18680 / JCM 14380 / FERM P-15431 / SF-1) TaxID=1321606 RepID=A0A0A8X5L8_MESS1|nr:hypothetical protein [Mesobacillus selenatarsenatis]GAM14564.1 hypothetical protein SAMD00020551_2715 [Mesobacillus selenatarsenatis SF-1]
MKLKKLLILVLLVAGMILGGCQQDNKEPVTENNSSAQKAEESSEDGFQADDKVVTINGKVFSYEDLQFYQLMNKVDIELNRAVDEKNLQGVELEEKMAYWDEQSKYHDNFNVNLSKMLEQHTMYLLAREKGLDVESAEVAGTIEEFKAKVEQNEAASQLVSAYPEDAYKNRLNSYFTEKLLTQQIYETLKADVVKEKPNATDKEIAYDTAKSYEELYQSQVASLEIKINAAGHE